LVVDENLGANALHKLDG